MADLRAAFDGVRVVDFTTGIAGSLATMHLADFGAAVTRVLPRDYDPVRAHPGSLRWDLAKRRVDIDLSTRTGRQEALSLVAAADVAVVDGGPAVLARHGLDYEPLAAINPRLLHAWVPPYGTTGEYSDLPADDGLLSALTGTAAMQFSYDERPVWLVTPVLTYGQGTLAALAIAAALFERRRSGLGQALVVSGLHGFQAMQSSAVRAGGLFREARGSRGGIPNYQLYRCADGQWFFLATLSQPFFVKALEAIGLIDLLSMDGVDGEMANLMTPPARDVAIARMDARFAERPRDEWLSILEANDVPCGPVLRRDEWARHETVRANDAYRRIDHPRLGACHVPGLPIGLSHTPARFGPGDPAAAEPPVTGQRHERQRRSGRDGPLSGVRVLDIGHALAGPFGPTVLAGLGADVIKVEPPGGDFYRAYGLMWSTCNRGKRSVVFDLRSERGRSGFRELARTADIVIDNFRPGVRRRLGVDYPALAALNPGIITGSVTAFGTSGAYASRPGFDPLLQAMSGLMDAQGGEDEPVFYQTAVNDHATALTIALGTVVALYARDVTGKGQEVTTSLTAQSLMFQSDEVTAFAGRPARPVGGRDCIGVSAFRRLYAASDGWLAVSCRTSADEEHMLRALGVPTQADRAPTGQTASAIEPAVREMSRSAALELLRQANVPAVPALSTEEMFDDPYLRANGVWSDFGGPGHDAASSVAGYAWCSRTPAGPLGDAPALGAHQAEVAGD